MRRLDRSLLWLRRSAKWRLITALLVHHQRNGRGVGLPRMEWKE